MALGINGQRGLGCVREQRVRGELEQIIEEELQGDPQQG
jgi:hypothetical protein